MAAAPATVNGVPGQNPDDPDDLPEFPLEFINDGLTKDRAPGAAGVPLLVKSWKYPRGIVLEILGSARWNRVEKRFDTFELVAIGTRFGGSHFVGRFNDPGPSPIGILFTLDSSGERIPPANLWAYGW